MLIKDTDTLFDILSKKYPEIEKTKLEGPLLGIELELELSEQEHVKIVHQANANIWGITTDNSLRGEAPIELVLRKPKPLKELNHELIDLYKVLNEHLTSPQSHRTSTHVHLNVLDLTNKQLGDLALTYCLLEPLFFKMVAPHRANNNFCVPVMQTNLATGFLATYHFSARNLIPCDKKTTKYAALGTSRLYDLGTMEFRHGHGYMPILHLLNFLEAITNLKNYVVARKNKTPIWTEVSANTNQLVAAVFSRNPTDEECDQILNTAGILSVAYRKLEGTLQQELPKKINKEVLTHPQEFPYWLKYQEKKKPANVAVIPVPTKKEQTPDLLF